MAALAALIVGVHVPGRPGLLRLGFVAALLSKPVLIGYLAGVAVIMIAGQLGKLFGVHRLRGHAPDARSRRRSASWADANAATAVDRAHGHRHAVRRARPVAPRLPWPLLAVLGATRRPYWLNLEELGVKVVGPIPRACPR